MSGTPTQDPLTVEAGELSEDRGQFSFRSLELTLGDIHHREKLARVALAANPGLTVDELSEIVIHVTLSLVMVTKQVMKGEIEPPDSVMAYAIRLTWDAAKRYGRNEVSQSVGCDDHCMTDVERSTQSSEFGFPDINCAASQANRCDNSDKAEIRSSPMDTRIAKLADAAWSMRTKSQRYVSPELQPYIGMHVAVFEQQIVAFGDNYAEVLHRAATECGVPTHRIIVDYWGNPARFQSIPEDEDV